MSTFRLGAFSFIDMGPIPIGIQQKVEIETRPGVDGHALFLTGARGEPFQVQTVVDVANVAAGALLFGQYENAVGDSASIIWAGVAHAKTFDILQVRPIQVNQIILGVGGLGGTSAGLVRAAWTLIAND